MGIIVNDGVRLPVVSLKRLAFAANTPYETRFRRRAPQAEVLFPREVAAILRKALGLVVEGGTAARLAGTLKDGAGRPLAIGGKTGTGDHRFERYGAGGQLLESRVVNRTATFVFYLGERHFGTFTALVPGREAEKYHFTSSLTAQILKNLLPRLQPILFAESLKPAPAPAPEAAAPVPEPPAKPKLAPLSKPKAEAREGTTHEAQPVKPEGQASGGFPENLDPVIKPEAPARQPYSPPVLLPGEPAPAPAPAP
jgi:membrane peptidoglycan carboxypeptidase